MQLSALFYITVRLGLFNAPLMYTAQPSDAYLPPIGVVLVTDLQNVSPLKPEAEWFANDLIVTIGTVVEVSSNIMLSRRESKTRE